MEAYLDNSATTRCSEAATGKMVDLLRENYGNPSSLHRKGMDAEGYITEAKKKIAKTLKVQEKEIVFTSGGTESNNLAILGSAEAMKRAGKHIITTAVEHASVSGPMEYLKERGYEVTYLSVDAYGVISLEELEQAMREDTILVSVMQVNNEIGAIEPIEAAGAIIKQKNPSTLFHVDGIQSYGKMKINPKKAQIDLLSVSGHKIHGPKGSGFLYIRDKARIKPILFGGGQQRGMRSGTENVPAIAGLGVAAEEMYRDLETNVAHLYELKEYFVSQVQKISGVSINGIMPESENVTGREQIQKTAPHIISVSVEGVRAEVLLHALEEKNVYVSAGSACSSNKPSVSKTLKSIGVKAPLLDSTVRFSFSVHTTKEEVDYALEQLMQIIPGLQKFVRR